MTRATTWRGEQHVRVLQALIPVKLSASAPPLGALELDQDYRAVDVGIGDARTRLALILGRRCWRSTCRCFRSCAGSRASWRPGTAGCASMRRSAAGYWRASGLRAPRPRPSQQLLSEQNSAAAELDRLKDDFVSLVSHELRTPAHLDPRVPRAALLDEGNDLTDEQRRFLGIVDRNSERLLSLVSDLLFLAQIEAGKLAIEVGVIDLETIAEESVETASPGATARSSRPDLTTDELPKLRGDRAQLARSLDNPDLERPQVHARGRPGRRCD